MNFIISSHSGQTTPTRNEDGYPKIWNQVFRVRFGKQRPHDNGDAAQDISEWGEGIVYSII